LDKVAASGRHVVGRESKVVAPWLTAPSSSSTHRRATVSSSREDGPDVFVHFSNIEGAGYRSLEEGQKVQFEVGQGRKGDEALKVTAI
jgi:CspA family cold shock protein